MSAGNREREIHREAKRLLRTILPDLQTLPRPHSEYIRCIVCDELVSIAEAEPVYDQTGEYYGWECERHI